jgi:predicted dehydrogenase
MNQSSGISRRNFLGKSALGMAGMLFLPTLYRCGKAPSDTVRLGFIGVGQQALYLLNGFISIPGVDVVACADVYKVKRDRFEFLVKSKNQEAGRTSEFTTYEDYREMIARTDIDAVVIASPDHWHAIMAIDCCKAGKDVYLEKPLTFTIREGQELVKAVRQSNVVLGVGSQQRSDTSFQHAVKIVQEGRLGRLTHVNAYVGAPPKPYDLPEEEIPAGLNWDKWLGPLPNLHFNNQLNPPISLDPPVNEQFWGGWRWYKEMGGGFTTDWGAHMFDIVQWALGRDNSGPGQIIPAGYGDAKHLTFIYDNGVVVTEEPFNDKWSKGVKFHGLDGWIEVTRDFFRASDDSLLPVVETSEEGEDVPYETKIPHLINFIESVRKRVDPLVPVEIGHRTCSMCTLGNIAHELQRPVYWDPMLEMFINDPAASTKVHYEYREGYSL